LQTAPIDNEFAVYCQNAIHEIEGMSLHPLGDIIQTIEKHAAKIESWDFGKKPEKLLPALNIRDLVFETS
jgi:hypothetical protein